MMHHRRRWLLARNDRGGPEDSAGAINVPISAVPTSCWPAEREFQITEYFPYVLGKVRRMSAKDFFSRMAQAVDIVAASLAPQAPQVAVCRESLSKAESAVGSATMGHGCQFVPVFICIATKP